MEKNNEKGKNIVIGILIGIIVCLVIALIFVSYNKFIVKNDTNTNTDTSNNSNVNNLSDNKTSNNQPIVFYSYNVENGKLNKNVVVNEKEITLKYEKDNLTINNKNINLNEGMDNIYIYNDLIFVHLYNAEKSLYRVYDTNGNLIKELNSSLIKYATFFEELELSSNKLLVEVRNVGNTGPYINDKVMVCGCGQCGDENKVDSYMNEINNSSLYSKAIYEVIYDDNKRTVDVKLDHITETVKDYINNSGQRCVSITE